MITRTAKRTSMPTKMSFAGWKGTWLRWPSENGDRHDRSPLSTHQASSLAKNVREAVNELHNRVEAIDELPILVPILLELVLTLFE